MNADIQDKLDAIKAPFQAMMDAADAIPALVDAAEKAKYDAGYADGKASVVLPDPNGTDKLFTQADMDQLAATAKAEQQKADQDAVQPQLDALSAQIADLKAQLAASPDELSQQIDALKVQVAGLQADLEAANSALAKKDQEMADFKAAELEKIKALEAEFGQQP
jgi:polyhydroxyalkanoate synthesis regulator phasin